MIGWFAPTGRPIHCLLTKSDKLTRQEQSKALRDTRAALADYGDAVTVQLFSSLKKTGIEEVEKIVGGWLGKKTETDQTGHDGEQEKPSATGGIAEGEVV
jgi:GTP-binding protein